MASGVQWQRLLGSAVAIGCVLCSSKVPPWLEASTNTPASLQGWYIVAMVASIAANGYLTIGQKQCRAGYVDLVWNGGPNFARDGSSRGGGHGMEVYSAGPRADSASLGICQ